MELTPSACISIFPTAVLSAGCTSEALRDVFLVSLSYYPPSDRTTTTTSSQNAVATALGSVIQNSTAQLLQVRVGFLGACAELPGDLWICSSSFETVARELAIVQSGAFNGTYDPLGIIHLARSFKEDVFFDGLMFTSVAFSVLAFLLLSTFPGWQSDVDSQGSDVDSQGSDVDSQGSDVNSQGSDVNSQGSDVNSQGSDIGFKPFPFLKVSQLVLSFLGISSFMTLLSAFGQHIASSNLATLMNLITAGVVQVEVGATAMGLGWATFVLNVVEFLAILTMVLSIHMLARPRA